MPKSFQKMSSILGLRVTLYMHFLQNRAYYITFPSSFIIIIIIII